jgi:hypothetical protein
MAQRPPLIAPPESPTAPREPDTVRLWYAPLLPAPVLAPLQASDLNQLRPGRGGGRGRQDNWQRRAYS